MIWFLAQSQQIDIVGNVYVQWGALGLLALVLGLVIRYLYSENKELKKENSLLKEKRIEDAREFATMLGQPAADLMKFVRTLYDLRSSESSRKDV